MERRLQVAVSEAAKAAVARWPLAPILFPRLLEVVFFRSGSMSFVLLEGFWGAVGRLRRKSIAVL